MVSFLTNFYANVSSESNLSKNKQTNFGYYNLRSKLLLTCCVQDVHGPSWNVDQIPTYCLPKSITVN